MGLNVTLASGPLGSVTVTEAAGVFSLNASLQASVGGGAVSGALKVANTTSVELGAGQLADVGMAAAAVAFPSLAAEIAILKGLMDAAIAKA